MVKRTQHIGTFLHNEMRISIGGISPMCGRSSIQRQKIFFLKPIGALPSLEALRRTWQRHYERTARAPASPGEPPEYEVRFKASRELPPAAEGIESPYDVEARYRHKRDTQWTGYMVHVSETCEPTAPHLLTHVHTTPATVHEA